MNPLSTSGTDGSGHDDRADDSLPSTDSSLPSSSPPTFTSLPPELISEIFESITRRPGSRLKDDRTLHSLCLVSRLFMQLARPILYREVYIDLARSFEGENNLTVKLMRTLMENAECRRLVKGLRIRALVGYYDLPLVRSVMMGHLLSHLSSLERIKVVHGSMGQLAEVIGKHRPGLKSLVLSRVQLYGQSFGNIIDKLNELEVFVGHFPLTLRKFDDAASSRTTRKLRKVVAAHPVELNMFSRFILPSRDTLTSLTITISIDTRQLDLSPFTNLTDLRLCLGAPAEYGLRRGEEWEEDIAKFATSLQRILRSTHSLSIRTLTISTSQHLVANALSKYSLFDVLPPTVVYLNVESFFLRESEINLASLLRAVRDRALPQLETITGLRYVNALTTDMDRHEEEEERLERIFEEAFRDSGLSFTQKRIMRDSWEPRSAFDLDSEDELIEDEFEESEESSEEESFSEEEEASNNDDEDEDHSDSSDYRSNSDYSTNSEEEDAPDNDIDRPSRWR
ncbi:uncharacterized protein JCM6883_006642 [Sporobolomyces salmoneus]|uniref:uncharacterized protein n=1 Tax=Sporobolomyces salmoneus TaxID=183962 RepID=UPI0031706FD6